MVFSSQLCGHTNFFFGLKFGCDNKVFKIMIIMVILFKAAYIVLGDLIYVVMSKPGFEFVKKIQLFP